MNQVVKISNATFLMICGVSINKSKGPQKIISDIIDD